jgi:alkylhydroperoxidase family enzyme
MWRKRAKPCCTIALQTIFSAMAHIPYVPPGEAEGLLGELRDRYRDKDGRVDNILWIHSLNPRSMRDHAELYVHLMRGPSPLSRVQREMIAVTVSAWNDCFY